MTWEQDCAHEWAYISKQWMYLDKWQYNHNPPADREHQLTVTWACNCGAFKQTCTRLPRGKGQFGESHRQADVRD